MIIIDWGRALSALVAVTPGTRCAYYRGVTSFCLREPTVGDYCAKHWAWRARDAV